MFKKISLVSILILLCLPVVVAGEGAGGWSGTSGGISNPLGSGSTFTTLIQGVIDWAIAIGILIAVIMIIWSGFLFMTSEGNEDKVTKAKKSLTWALVGLLILLIGDGFIGIVKDLLGT